MRAYRGVPGGVRNAIQNAVADSPLLSASLRRKLGHTVLGRGANIESLYLNNFYCAFGAEEQQKLLSAHFDANPYANFLGRWEVGGAVADPAPPALRRPEDLPGRTADEAGPDEHGVLHRKPGAVPRS